MYKNWTNGEKKTICIQRPKECFNEQNNEIFVLHIVCLSLEIVAKAKCEWNFKIGELVHGIRERAHVTTIPKWEMTTT